MMCTGQRRPEGGLDCDAIRHWSDVTAMRCGEVLRCDARVGARDASVRRRRRRVAIRIVGLRSPHGQGLRAGVRPVHVSRL